MILLLFLRDLLPCGKGLMPHEEGLESLIPDPTLVQTSLECQHRLKTEV